MIVLIDGAHNGKEVGKVPGGEQIGAKCYGICQLWDMFQAVDICAIRIPAIELSTRRKGVTNLRRVVYRADGFLKQLNSL